jgi:diguanylate cyclase (GGDEF)-like protein
MSAADLEAEVRRLRAQIAALTEEATINERLFRKNRQRELELLNASGITQLFDTICRGLLVSYGLERVTLVLCDPEHEIRHLLLADRVRLEDYPEVVFTDTLHALAPQLISATEPWLGPFRFCDHQLLFPGERELGSVALIPLARQDRLQGSLNFGSRDPQRFTRHLGTDFLAQLGAITTFAIENTLNRSRLVRSGLTDFLTGWHNRRYLQARLREELARAARQGTALACVIVDIDHFKEVNDRYGHLAGDAALRETAHRIDGEVRGSDASARYGGDEFVVLIPGVGREQTLALAERIRLAVGAVPVEAAPGQEIPLTVSVGVALVHPSREQGRDLKTLSEALLAESDAALYRAKQRGRNRVELAGV